MEMPKSRCGETTSSSRAESGMRSNGSILEESSVSLARMARQRCACSRSRLTSSAYGESGSIARSRSVAITGMVEGGGPRLCAGGGSKSVDLREVLLARQYQLGGGQRVGKLALLLRELPSVHGDESEREQGREPYSHDVRRRQRKGLVRIPRQRVIIERQHGCAE